VSPFKRKKGDDAPTSPPPPGSPPGPPPGAPASRPAADLDRYRSFLEEHGGPTDGLAEEVGLRIGGWGFYHRGSGAARTEVVALDGDGHAVTESGTGDWYELLTASGLDATGALRRVAWLLGRPAPIKGDHTVEDGAEEVIADPSLEVDGDSVRFEGWVVYPPATKAPHRLSVDATAGSTATLESTTWREV
jgi:hypothetical protein